MAQRPAYAREILEMRRFGDRRPLFNMLVITDNRLVRAACEKLGMSALIVEPFLPYNLDVCYDLDAWVLMTHEDRRIREALRRAKPRSVQIDKAGLAFWQWIEWIVENRRRTTMSAAQPA